MKKKFTNLFKIAARCKLFSKTLAMFLAIVTLFYVIPSVIYAEVADALTEEDSAAAEEESSLSYDYEYEAALYEDTALRENSVKHFHLEDGSYVAAQYSYPVHVKNDNGEWEDINNSLSENIGGSYVTENARIKFAKKITGNSTLFTLKDGNTKLTMMLEGAIKGTVGTVTNGSDNEYDDKLQKMMNLENISSEILYADILAGVDLQYEVYSLNVKENIIVKERTDNYSYTFEIKLNNLSAVLSDEGDVIISDKDGNLKYKIPAPIVYDRGIGIADKEDAYYTLEGSGNKYTLTVTIDSEWMNSEDRVYPITIDPTVEAVSSSANSAFILSNENYQNYPYISITSNSYGFWQNSLPTLSSNVYPTSATLSIPYNSSSGRYTPTLYMYEVLASWKENIFTAIQKQGTTDYISDEVFASSYFSGGLIYCWDITDLVTEWYADPSSNYGVAFTYNKTETNNLGVSIRLNSNTNSFSTPYLKIGYVNLTGVEKNYTTSSQDLGIAGFGNVIHANGNLNFTIPTLATTDNLFGYSVNLVYNSALAGLSYEYPYTDNAYTTSYMPCGFKLNICETILRKSYTDENGYLVYYYIYEDADGTSHIFFNSDSENESMIYYDSNGMNMVMTVTSSAITITDDSKLERLFLKKNFISYLTTNEGWYLKSITDTIGNTLSFEFDSYYRPTKVSVIPNGLSAIDFLTLTYNNSGILSSITNSSSYESVFFTYQVDNYTATPSYYLTEITFKNNNAIYKASYEYNGFGELTCVNNEISGQSLLYQIDLTNHKISSVTHLGINDTIGQEVLFEYGLGYTKVISSGSDDNIDYGVYNEYSSDDIITQYTFDENGRTLSAYSYTHSDNTVLGGTMVQYEEQYNIKNNLKESTVINGFEDDCIFYEDFEEALYSDWRTNLGTEIETLEYDYSHAASACVTYSETSRFDFGDSYITVPIYSQINGDELSDEYLISGFARSSSAIPTGIFALMVTICYIDETDPTPKLDHVYFNFSSYCDDWQFTAGTISTTSYESVKYIDLYCVYSKQIQGYALFDNISISTSCGNKEHYYTYTEGPATGLISKVETDSYTEYYEYTNNRELNIIANSDGNLTYNGYNTNGLIGGTLEYRYSFCGTTSYPIEYENAFDLIEKSQYRRTDYIYNNYGLCILEDSHITKADGTDINNSYHINHSFEYDTTSGSKIFGALIYEKNSFGTKTNYYYDNNDGKLLATINPDERNGICYTYDEIGNLTGVTPATYVSSSNYSPIVNSEEVEYTYNEYNLLSSISTKSTTYSFIYDSFGNTSSISIGDAELASYEYNEHNGKLNKITYANGLVVEYSYNELELLENVWYTNNNETTLAYEYEYTDDGQVSRFIDNVNGRLIEYLYDSRNRLTEISEYDSNENSENYLVKYNYDNDDRISDAEFNLYYSNGTSLNYLNQKYYYFYDAWTGKIEASEVNTNASQNEIEYIYDGFDRLSKEIYESNVGYSNTVEYTYLNTSDMYTSSFVETYSSLVNEENASSYTYTYDKNGFITKISYSTGKELRYVYDDLGQLLREDNELINATYSYTYDDAGNILSKSYYELTAENEALGTPRSTNSYEYEDSEWGDLLTSYNGKDITYDELGNPLSYNSVSSYTFSWTGKNLTAATKGLVEYTFTYNEDGIRTSKTKNGVKTTYYVSGSLILAEETNNNLTVYVYDTNGSPIGMQYHAADYAEDVWDIFWYEKNLQGDIVAIYDEDGTKLISYKYDAWGGCWPYPHNGGYSTAAFKNPFRYRGYYYDLDLELYYLGSRYYDKNTGRFISADKYASTGQGILGYNMFAYCANNPVNYFDPTGNWPKWLSGALNVVGGALQVAAGAALGATVGWTGFGAVAAGFLIVNGTATAAQGVGQIVNHVTNSNVLREDNIVRTGVQEVGRSIGGDTGAKIAGGAYDVAVVATNLYAGKVGLQQAGKLPIKVNINNVVNNPLDEFVTIGPADGVIQQYCRTIPQSGYGKIYATQLGNGLYQIANGHHRVAALRALGYETIKIFLTK